MAVPALPAREGDGTAPRPNQWIKDHLDALIDARLLPEGGQAAPRARRGRAFRGARQRSGRARSAPRVAPDPPTGRHAG